MQTPGGSTGDSRFSTQTATGEGEAQGRGENEREKGRDKGDWKELIQGGEFSSAAKCLPGKYKVLS